MALSLLSSTKKSLVRVKLDKAALAWDVIKNIRRWWNGEITGEQCLDNIIDQGVTIAGGLAGVIGMKLATASIGALAGPVGLVAGAVGGFIVGEIIGSVAAETLGNRLREWIFGHSKRRALENAYDYLSVSSSDSNSVINTRYRKLALKYHPDKGGDKDKWTRLQYSMAVIREAREES